MVGQSFYRKQRLKTPNPIFFIPSSVAPQIETRKEQSRRVRDQTEPQHQGYYGGDQKDGESGPEQNGRDPEGKTKVGVHGR